jgi:hypothetical protein
MSFIALAVPLAIRLPIVVAAVDDPTTPNADESLITLHSDAYLLPDTGLV